MKPREAEGKAHENKKTMIGHVIMTDNNRMRRKMV